MTQPDDELLRLRRRPFPAVRAVHLASVGVSGVLSMLLLYAMNGAMAWGQDTWASDPTLQPAPSTAKDTPSVAEFVVFVTREEVLLEHRRLALVPEAGDVAALRA